MTMTYLEPTLKRTLGGQTALVTGAAGGLGGALAQTLAARGVTVIACDVNEGGLQTIAAADPQRILPYRLDLSDADAIVRAVHDITARYGEVDMLLHAAIRHIGGDDGREARAFGDHTPAQVMETLAVSVTGPTLLTQLIAQQMVARRTGRIVITGSMHRTGTAGIVMYAAAKAYLNTLARGLFLELRNFNVVTTVANPGGMNTQLHDFRSPWMLDPRIVAETIVAQLELPGNAALLSFDLVPHDPQHPDMIG